MYKPEGFAAGAGHGSLFAKPYGNMWHIGTTTISQKHIFERRLGLYPAYGCPEPERRLIRLPGIHTGDFMHPNKAGYRKMGSAVSLYLFE